MTSLGSWNYLVEGDLAQVVSVKIIETVHARQ